MTIDALRKSLSQAAPPPGLSPPLQALWHDAKGDWDAAHRVAQDIDDDQGAWVHAYLHRQEGDEGNAAYWYRRAGRPVAKGSLTEEWTQLAESFLRGSG